MSSELDNKLKTVSIKALENAIAKAVSELIGDELECQISNVSYEGFLIAGAKFEAKISIPLKP